MPSLSRIVRGGAAFTSIAATLSMASGLVAAEPQAPTLKVSGTATFSTETRVTGETFEVRAVLADEVGRPIANAETRVRATSNDTPPSLRRCGDGRNDNSGQLTLVTDAAGRACVFVSGMHTGAVDFSFEDPRGYYERAERHVSLPDSAADVFELGFDPPFSTLSLDRPLQSIGLVARARAGAALPDAAELVLSLAEGSSERELTRVALDGLGETHRLSLVSATFGQPGPARLIARLRARSGEERAIVSSAVLRTVTAVIDVPDARAGVEPGASVQVSVASALGPAPSGAVEARSAGRSIAAAPVRNGVATLVLPSAPTTLLGSLVSFEYVGEGPGWLSGAPIEVRVRPPAPGYARSALWILAAVLAGLAVVLGWRRPARPRPAPATQAARSRASVEVIEAFGPSGGYRGRVRDAHEGTPVAPAVVSFLSTGANARVLLQLRTNAEGEFSTESTFPSETLLEVTAPFHTTLTAALPGPATLAAAASTESEPQVETWARAVEHLAFGAIPPDAAREQAAGVTADPKTARERGID